MKRRVKEGTWEVDDAGRAMGFTPRVPREPRNTEYTPAERLRHNVVVTIHNIKNWPATMTHDRIVEDLMAALQGKTLEELT